MVIFRAIQKVAYPKRQIKYPRFRNPVQYLISDSAYRKKKKSSPKQVNRRPITYKHVPLKRLEGTTNVTDVSTTAQVTTFNDIPQGTSVDGERTEQQVVAHSLNYKSTILWEGDGAQSYYCTTVRFILCTVTNAFSPSALYTTTNIYDKRDWPEIGHVYKDFRVVRHQSNTIATPIHIFQNLKGIRFQYDGDAATDQMDNRYSKLILIIVGDQNTPTKTDMNQTRYVLRYRG